MKRQTNKVKASLVKYASLIITLAVIAAFGAVSCSPPDLDLTDYDWNKANERNDPSKSDSGDITFTSSFTVTDPTSANKPEITIAFPAQSDFLRSSSIEAGLKEFLTVYNFEALPTLVENPDGNDGKANPLSAALDYTLESAAGTAVTIKVNKDYTAAGIGDYSDLVIKIDSTKYKHSGGLLMDYDHDGKAGEAGYDDIYKTVSVTGSAAGLNAGDFIAPGNKGWYISLQSFPTGWTFTGDATTSDNMTAAYAKLNLSGISTTSVNGKAIYAEIAGLVTNNIKIEKLGTNGTWTAESASAVYDPDTFGYDFIGFKDFNVTHGAAYRVTYNGSANLSTAAEYFGVKQRLYVSGVTPNTTYAPYDTAKARYALTKVSGAAGTVTGSSVTYITTKDFKVQPFSSDANNKNVVLELKINDFRGTPPDQVGLDSAVINDLNRFKASFKIVHATSNITAIASLWSNPNLTYLNITKVEGIANPVAPGSTTTAIDTLRITLDPAATFNVGLTWVPGAWVPESTDHTNDVWVNDTYTYTEAEDLWQDGDPDDPNDEGSFNGTEGYYYYSDGSGGYYSVYFDNDTTKFDATDNPTGYDPDKTYYTREVDELGHYDHSGDVTIPGYYDEGYYQTTQTGSDYYYILINDGFGYTGGKYLYGSLNYQYDNFALYDINNP
jgi:hypothetical protein